MIKMRWLLFLIFALALASPCFGQIAHDTDSVTSGTGDLAWNHTSAGANRLLKVSVQWEGSGADRTITAITCDGAAMTSVGAKLQWITWKNIQDFYIVGAAVGVNAIAVTFSGAVSSSIAGGTSLTGVDQSTPLDAANSASGNGTAPSVNVTTVADNAWIVDSMAADGSYYAHSPDAPQVISWDPSPNDSNAGSYKGPVTPAGATTTSWTLVGTHNWGIYANSFKPAAGGGAAKRRVTISD